MIECRQNKNLHMRDINAMIEEYRISVDDNVADELTKLLGSFRIEEEVGVSLNIVLEKRKYRFDKGV